MEIKSIWFDKEKEINPLRIPTQTEVLIVGGGIAGLSAALFLSQMKIKTLVLEKNHLGFGATGRSDGQVLLATGEHPSRIVSQLGEKRAFYLFSSMEENLKLIESLSKKRSISFIKNGGYRLAENENEVLELKQSLDLLKRHGKKARYLDENDLAKELPSIDRFLGALFRDEEAVVHPYKLIQALEEEARTSGAEIVQKAEVKEVKGHLGSLEAKVFIESKNKEELKIRTKAVLLASSYFSSEVDNSGFLNRVLFPFRAQALAVQTLPEEFKNNLPESPMSSHFCYEYFRRSGDILVVGGMRWSVRGEEVGITDDSLINHEVHNNLVKWIKLHFPSLQKPKITNAWTGILCGTPDGLPISGMIPGKPGFFVLAGFNGYGLSMAMALAKSVSQEIVQGQSSYVWSGLFRPDRFA